MKPMFLAFVAIALIAIASNQALNNAGWSAADRASGSAVRLD